MNKKSLLKIAKEFRKEANKNFGRKCEVYDIGCIVCSIHRVIDDLENVADYIEALDK